MAGASLAEATAAPGFAFAETEEQALLAEGTDRLVCERKIGACRLFDVAKDPGERDDLARVSRDRFDKLRAELSALVHLEFQQLRQELTGPFCQIGTGARLLGGSAVLGSMAAGGATALAIRLLDRRLPAATSAAVVTAAFGTGASALAAAGRPRIRREWTPIPENTTP